MNLVDYIAGELVERGLDSLVVAVGGMGLRIRTSSRTAAEAPAVGEPVRLVTVGGVGPRSDLAALSLLSAEQNGRRRSRPAMLRRWRATRRCGRPSRAKGPA